MCILLRGPQAAWASHESHPPWGAVPHTGGRSAAPRASTHYMPAAPPPHFER